MIQQELPKVTPQVPGIGPYEAKMIFVGQSPGIRETSAGRPFVGNTGRFIFDPLLQALGISRHEVFITNVIQMLKPNDDVSSIIDLSGSKIKETPEWRAWCVNLVRELSKVQSNLIIAMGAEALYALTGHRSITKWRGTVLPSTLLPGRKVLPTLHPASAFHGSGVRHIIGGDLVKGLDEARYPEIIRPEYNLILNPSYDIIYDTFETAKRQKHFSWDIEINATQEIASMAIGLDKTHAIAIPLRGRTENSFGFEEELRFWNEFSKLMYDLDVEVWNQNIKFDAYIALIKHHIITQNIEDPMVAHKVLYPELPMRLGFLTSMYTRQPYYKEDGKVHFKEVEVDESFLRYNALDVITVEEILPQLKRYLEARGLVEVYERRINSIPVYMEIQRRGYRLDKDELSRQRAKAENIRDKLQDELVYKIGHPINLNSTKQVGDFFYKERGIKPYYNKGKDGKYSRTTDENALKKLARVDHAKTVRDEARLMLEYRSVEKLISTYYKPNLDLDGRVRGEYNPVGTKFGRPSCSQTIFGTGYNMLTFPHSFKTALIPDEGYLAYNLDLAQAENRLVALFAYIIGGDDKMLNAFESGKDVHRLTASLFFNKLPEEISNEPGSSNLGNGTHSERYWGKKGNHSLNYLIGFYSLADQLGITVQQAKMLINKYMTGYPGVPLYHKWVEQMITTKPHTLTNLLGSQFVFLGPYTNDTFREGCACIPQSTVAEIVMQYGLFPIYYLKDEVFRHVELLNYVYDSIEHQLKRSLPIPIQADILWKIKTNMEVRLTLEKTSIVIPVDISVGNNFNSDEMIELGHLESKDHLISRLEEVCQTI